MTDNSLFAGSSRGADDARASIDDAMDLYGVRDQLADSELSQEQQAGMIDLLRKTAEYHEYHGAEPQQAVQRAVADFNNLAASAAWRDLSSSPDEVVFGTVRASALEGKPTEVAQAQARPNAAPSPDEANDDDMPDFSNNPDMQKLAPYWRFYKQYGRLHGIDPILLMAQAAHETRDLADPNIPNKARALGLAQIRPSAAEDVGESWEAQIDPETNIRTQAAYLALLRRRHGLWNDPLRMLMVYNAGGRNVGRAPRQGEKPSAIELNARGYANNVKAIYNKYVPGPLPPHLPLPPTPRPEDRSAVPTQSPDFDALPEPRAAPTPIKPLPLPPKPRPPGLGAPRPGRLGLLAPILDDLNDPDRSPWGLG